MPEGNELKLLILIALALLVGGYLWYLEKRRPQSRADALAETYKTLTAAMLTELPDEQLLEAVVANVVSKQDKRKPEPYYTLPLLSPGRSAVYSVWVVCREVESASFGALLERNARPLTQCAVAGMTAVGAPRCAAALEQALLPGADRAALASAFAEAVQAEQPLALCIAYIRENPTEFTDEDQPEA